MLDVSFRFYGPLNDFLPPLRRGRRFHWRLPASASVKDTIEALGVPHPEVEVIIVNGEPGDFARRLRDGDDVAVFPVFRTLDVAGLPRVGSRRPAPVRFVLDVHLGKLGALLRLAGFDSVVLQDDEIIAAIAREEGRVALTRDVGLLKRGAVRHGYWVRQTDPERQLAEILDRFDLSGEMDPFGRCLRCNAPWWRRPPRPCANGFPPAPVRLSGSSARVPGADASTGEGRTTNG